MKKVEFIIKWYESNFENLLSVIEYSVAYIDSITKEPEVVIGVIYGPDTKYSQEFKNLISQKYKVLPSNCWGNGLLIGNKHHCIRIMINE